MQELSFFVGKGGVGKTTVSAAFAVRTALTVPSSRVLLLSTDPAHSLSDVLQFSLSDSPTPVPLPKAGSLEAWQLNSEKLFGEFLRKHKESILKIIDAGSIFSREDIEPLLDNALPGMAEVSGLLAIHESITSGKYSHIVVDTAPFGHTLRLFGLPRNFLRFLDFLELAASRDRLLSQHFGGSAKASVGSSFIEEWRETADSVNGYLAEDARLFLVTTPEQFSLNESVRCSEILKTYSPPMHIDAVVLNRCVTRAVGCKVCRNRAGATRTARTFLKKHFPGKPVHIGEDPAGLIAGVETLAIFAGHVFADRPLRLHAAMPKVKAKSPRLNRVKWPLLETPLTFVLGKGGVGKTTISAAMGFNSRRRTKQSVQICSVDPAPSLDDIFQKAIGDEPVPVLGDAKFLASEMDSVALFAEWVSEVRANIEDATGTEVSGIHLDLSFERQLLSNLLDIVPPGVDEVLAIFRILNLLDTASQRILIDMAPTGHALELLRMPDRILAWTRPLLKTLAAHRTLAGARDAAVKIAELGQGVRELAGTIKNKARTRIHIVLLPELLPDRETERLISDLQRLDLIPGSLFINRVIFAKDAGKCQRCKSAMRSQQNIMNALKNKYPEIDLYAVRNFPGEVAGKTALAAFTGELWQLA